MGTEQPPTHSPKPRPLPRTLLPQGTVVLHTAAWVTSGQPVSWLSTAPARERWLTHSAPTARQHAAGMPCPSLTSCCSNPILQRGKLRLREQKDSPEVTQQAKAQVERGGGCPKTASHVSGLGGTPWRPLRIVTSSSPPGTEGDPGLASPLSVSMHCINPPGGPRGH